QEVIRMILEAYYEPQFSNHSHGFRPERGCHTALSEVAERWTGTKWFLEGDIKGCFDHIDHQILIALLRERLHDNRFLRLIQNLLQAGYLEDWKYHRTYSGTPQGSIVSPILANIYLNELDQFVRNLEYNKGKRRTVNPQYHRITKQKSKLRKQIKNMVDEKVDAYFILP